MFFQIGNSVYELLKSPVSFSSNENVSYAEHALIGAKPKLQPTGIELKNLQIVFRLRQNFCDIKTELQQFQTQKNTYEVLPLLWGNGTLEGDFVISEYSIDGEEFDSIGNLIAVTVSLGLKEFVVKDKQKQGQLEAKKNAFAVNKPGENKKPVSTPKKNPATCCNTLSNMVSRIKNIAAKVDANVRAYLATTEDTLENKYRFLIDTDCTNIIAACDSIISFQGDCISKAPKLKQWATDVKSSANFLKQTAKIAPIIKGKIKIDNGTMQTRLKSLLNESTPVVKCAATRS